MEDIFCNLKVCNNGKEQTLRAMIDTGNLLKDPITNSPVIIIEKKTCSNILPKEILDNTDKIINGRYEFSDEYLKYASKFRVLPFSSLGKQNGMLLGFKVDKIEAEINNEEIIREDAIVGIYDKKLSNRNRYQGLIGLNYVEKNC